MMTNDNSSDLLTPREVADMLRVTQPTLAVWRCRKRYPLPYIKVGSRVCYRRSAVEKFLALRTVGQK